jgi:zinc transport system ATP-binding protein
MESAVSIKNLTVNYENVEAIKDINLEIEDKDYLAILGPNGGGKSTLLKVILGLIKPSKGEIKIFGKSPEASGSLIGYVPQFSKFDRNFPINVMDVILMGQLKNKFSLFHKFDKCDLEKCNKIMDELQISDLKKRQIGQLSGGQKQKVLIARALIGNPKILLLDEPTASLDSSATNMIYSLLKKLNDTMTIVIVTHDIGVISSYVKNIACLNKKLYYHGESKLTEDIIEHVYGCQVDLVAHGIPHRVLKSHK